MAKVIYQGPSDAVVTPDGVVFKRGEAVEVSDDVARALTRQNFKTAPATKKEDA